MISAIVLAAGQSQRMGRQKLLLPFHGRPLIAKVVDDLLRSPIDHVLVVIGREGKPITEALAGRSVSFVTNTHDEDEMLWSVRCGLAAVPEETSAVIVALGDQLGITAEVVGTLVQSFRTGDRGIVVPTYEGKRGHPLLFVIDYRDEILSRYEGQGLRALLNAHPEDVFDLEVASAGILDDIDLPEDYQRALVAVDLDATKEKSRDAKDKPRGAQLT